MKVRKALGALLGAAILSGSLIAPHALAVAPAPTWLVQPLAVPTNFKPGEESGRDLYEVLLTNTGAGPTDGSPITITDTLPKGIGVKGVELETSRYYFTRFGPGVCQTQTAAEVSTVTCTVDEGSPVASPVTVANPALLYGGEQLRLEIRVTVPPTASGPLANQVTIEGGGAESASGEIQHEASAEEASSGYEEFQASVTGPDGKPATGAGSHPYQYSTAFAVNTAVAPNGDFYIPAKGDLKQIEVALPPGLAGNPTSTPRCSAQQFTTTHGKTSSHGLNYFPNECPDASAVGLANIEQFEGLGEAGVGVPLYNLVPPKGMPAQLGFQPSFGLTVYINTKLRSDGDYGVTSYLPNLPEVKRFSAVRTTIWGTPADPSHDRLRGECVYTKLSCPAEVPPRPFWRLPSSCDAAMVNSMSFATWTDPNAFVKTAFSEPTPVGCELPPFDPSLAAKPTTTVADAPSGLNFNLHLPQKENEDPEGLGEADLRETKVTLPEGLLVNPASADGLAGCSLAQIGYEGVREGRQSFSASPANCPDAAKIGTVEINAPAVDHPLPGAVYLAQPHANPFNSLLALYITVSDPQTGVVVKLPARVDANPVTGQLTTTVKESPQVPFEDFKLDFFEGARAPLRTPAICGTHTTTSSLTPWSAPASGSPATPSDSFQTTLAPGGGACPTSAAQQPNSPSFEAGTQSPIAGAYSPFVLRLRRADGSQEIKGLNLSLPLGLAARFAGVAECPAAALAAAEGKSGKAEQASPSCPVSSQLGTVNVGAGAGPAPFYAQGHAYLSGPYKGAPLSMAIITPAVAGPFDLGTVVVRAALEVNPETAQGSVTSDPIPTILDGIPLDIRSIAVNIDRNQFTLNPTSCEAKAVTGNTVSTLGQSASLSNRFQVGGCSNLGFKPKLSLQLKGGTKRGDHPALLSTLTYPKGSYANIASAQVALPHSEFLDQGHIRTVCTRVQFAASQCPKRSIYGYAKAITPLLDQPLQGPVYLRSSSHQLPDLVADLNGQIHFVLDGRTDSIRGGLRSSFETVPDAPVSKFTLELTGGKKKGLLENSTDLCKGTHKATANFIAQNGKLSELRPVLAVKCGGKGSRPAKPEHHG